MKIMFVMNSLGTGGAERSTAYLWYFLRLQEIDHFIVVTEHRKEGIENEILSNGFPVYFLKEKSFFKKCLELIRLIKKEKPDIVHSILFYSNLLTRFSKALAFTPFVHVESLVSTPYDENRGLDPNIRNIKLILFKWFNALTINLFTDKLHAITNLVRDHYVKELKLNPKHIKVIYRGREFKRSTGIEERSDKTKLKEIAGISESDFILIHIGRQEFVKGQIYLLRAMEILKKEGFSDIKLLICGREGHATPSLKKFHEENLLHDQVFFLGHRHDVFEWLAASDAFIFTSLFEGLGGALIEAQAAALPVIAFDLPYSNEVLLPGENAILALFPDAGMLAAGAKNLYKRRDDLKSMRHASRKNFEDKFQLSLINRQMVEWYREISTSQISE